MGGGRNGVGVRQSDVTVCAAALRPTGTHGGQAESSPELQRGFRPSLRDSVALGTKLSWATWPRQKDPWVRGKLGGQLLSTGEAAKF